MRSPYEILDALRCGEALGQGDLEAVVDGATDGDWEDAQLGAFLMAVAIRGLTEEEVVRLARGMLASGARWNLAEAVPGTADKHSTGGVGDKVSLVLTPLLAACDVPVAMLTGRGLGHTGGTADKLEAIPGVALAIDRASALASLKACGMAIGVATDEVAPADRRLYALRDVTGTVASIPLIVASILSKKLALGAGGVIYDVKAGSGAIFENLERAAELAGRLVDTSRALGQPARALVTDMNQPLGHSVGHAAEVNEALACLAGEGPDDLATLSVELAAEAAELLGYDLSRHDLHRALETGRGREVFLAWAEHRGADRAWLRRPLLELAPREIAVDADAVGWLGGVDSRRLGLLLAEFGGGRRRHDDVIDHGVAIHTECRIGQRVEEGDRLARVVLRREDTEAIEQRVRDCFAVVAEPIEPPSLVARRIAPADESG